MMETVFRYEHRDTRTGPFWWANESNRTAAQLACETNGFDADGYTLGPDPHDGPGVSVDIARNHAGERMPFNAGADRCCCRSEGQLHAAWFRTAAQRQLLASLGFVLAEYSAPVEYVRWGLVQGAYRSAMALHVADHPITVEVIA